MWKPNQPTSGSIASNPISAEAEDVRADEGVDVEELDEEMTPTRGPAEPE